LGIVREYWQWCHSVTLITIFFLLILECLVLLVKQWQVLPFRGSFPSSGMFVRTCIPIMRLVGDSPHQGRGIDRYISKVICGLLPHIGASLRCTVWTIN
jgi:hypothetical protein